MGKGKQQAEAEMMETVQLHGGIPFSDGGQMFAIPVTRRYKHVRCIKRPGNISSADTVVKMAIIRRAAKPLKNYVFRNPDLPVSVKIGVANTHVLPTG